MSIETVAPQATHLTAEQIEHFRERLLDIREMITGQVQSLAQTARESTEATENSKSPLNSAENASDAFEQDLAFLSMESEEELLAKVEMALERIQEGSYGVCAATGEEIPMERLEIMPWAELCIKAQRMEEEGILIRRQTRDGEEFEVIEAADHPNLAGDDYE